jgi:hypothetical protein
MPNKSVRHTAVPPWPSGWIPGQFNDVFVSVIAATAPIRAPVKSIT